MQRSNVAATVVNVPSLLATRDAESKLQARGERGVIKTASRCVTCAPMPARGAFALHTSQLPAVDSGEDAAVCVAVGARDGARVPNLRARLLPALKKRRRCGVLRKRMG